MNINKPLLKQMLDKKLVMVQKHPTEDLFIYNYTAKVQYDKLWNEITLITRGLILDSEMNIIARPFQKFFNIEEIQSSEIPVLPFDVYEKLDGSLGILYLIQEKPFFATRGSFESDQAKHATGILYTKYYHTFDKLEKNKTYLFEIIYPENRIVINYGDKDDIVLLTIIDNDTGKESIQDIGFTIVKKYNGLTDLNKLKELQEENKEGFVVRFENNFRMKVKFDEYVRLHRIITGISNIAIWEYLKDNKPIDELLEKVPDEFYKWVINTCSELKNKYESIKDQSLNTFKNLYDNNKKEFALRVLNEAKDLSGVLFAMYAKKNYVKIIWKMIRPKHSRAFKAERMETA